MIERRVGAIIVHPVQGFLFEQSRILHDNRPALMLIGGLIQPGDYDCDAAMGRVLESRLNLPSDKIFSHLEHWRTFNGGSVTSHVFGGEMLWARDFGGVNNNFTCGLEFVSRDALQGRVFTQPTKLALEAYLPIRDTQGYEPYLSAQFGIRDPDDDPGLWEVDD